MVAHVMGTSIPNILHPGAFVWFEKTQGPLVKVVPVPRGRPMMQLAVCVRFLRCGSFLDDLTVEGVLSLVFIRFLILRKRKDSKSYWLPSLKVTWLGCLKSNGPTQVTASSTDIESLRVSFWNFPDLYTSAIIVYQNRNSSVNNTLAHCCGVQWAFSFGRLDYKNSPQSHIVRVYDAGHGKSGVFHSAEWHVGDWSSDGIREAWLRFFIWVGEHPVSGQRPSTNLTRGLVAGTPCHEGTLHLQTYMPSPRFGPRPYGTSVNVANHFTR
ncbi:uncharacterized protein TNCV_4112391 [Trichonephila clavipes]|nr:uncharacterized protein TNCV_4112391 [Trichonephila clavipes]